MSNLTKITTETLGAVEVLTIDGQEVRNAMNIDVYAKVTETIRNLKNRPEIRAIVITGAGPFFSSGGNIQILRDSQDAPPAQSNASTDQLNSMIRNIADCPVPVIAAVEGGAAGAGFSLVLACDMIVSDKEASFTASYVRVGLTPDGGMTHFLTQALPKQMVMDMCIFGKPTAATTLAGHGMINELCETGQALETALAMADKIAKGPRESIRNIKRLVHAAKSNSLPEHLIAEADGINTSRFGPEAREGLGAFLEKRRANFEGL
jgi:enoyl-CoA hydratase/carnithine racemase